MLKSKEREQLFAMIHCTTMGEERIRRNLNLTDEDVVFWCIEKMKDSRCQWARKGKNWYCVIDDYLFTIHATAYTIITAKKIQSSVTERKSNDYC